MTEFVSFFLVLLAAILFSTFFKHFHVPWVVALIIGGIFVGPHGTGLVEITPSLDFLGQIGLVFLMFMAGLETKLSRLRKTGKESLTIAAINGVIPLTVGMGIGFWLGYGVLNTLMVGIVFVSSSIVASLPSLENNRLINTRVGTTVIGSTVLQDIFALLLLAGLLQVVDPTSFLPLPVFLALLTGSVFLMWWSIPRLQWIFQFEEKDKEDLFEKELRLAMVILVGTVVFFEAIGVHPIVAGFIAGLVLSEAIESEEMTNKIHAVSYGLFIPIFFVLVGMQTDLGVFARTAGTAFLTAAIVIGSMLAKYSSGFAAGRLEGFTPAESSVIGSTSIPQLSTTLAVIFIGAEVGLLGGALTTALIVLSIVTTLTGPILIDLTLRWMSEESEREMRERE